MIDPIEKLIYIVSVAAYKVVTELSYPLVIYMEKDKSDIAPTVGTEKVIFGFARFAKVKLLLYVVELVELSSVNILNVWDLRLLKFNREPIKEPYL